MGNKVKKVIVVGAGAIGLSCGYHLALKGLDVTIIERDSPGSGQSTKTGGGIRYFHGSDENVRMSFISKEFWDQFYKLFRIDPNYRETGHLFLTANSRKSQKLYNNVNREVLNLEILKKPQIEMRWPHLSQLSLEYGVYCQLGGYLDHHNVIAGLVNGFEKAGGILKLGIKAHSLITSENKVIGINSSDGPLNADAVLNCSGAMVSQLAEHKHKFDPFKSRHHELIIVSPKTPIPEATPWLIDIDQQVHLRPDGQGRALVGGFLGENEDTDVLDYNSNISNIWSKRILKAAHCSFGLTPVKTNIVEHWGGLYPGTIDYKPVMEQTQQGFFTAAGFAGTGLMHAPAAGIILCDLITNGHTNKIKITEFSSERFAKPSKVSETTGF